MTGQSPGWTGAVAGSPFERRFERLTVPEGATRLRVNFASGGSESVTGTVVIDDLSVRLSLPLITEVTRDGAGVTLVWNSVPGANYTVLFAESLSGAPGMEPFGGEYCFRGPDLILPGFGGARRE